jgi:DNA-binding transcriptional LysR family regulator
MELRHLRYFVAVAGAQSFSRAAKQLRISQPPLSAQIRALEEELGARLFQRSFKGASLTEVGQAFLPKARAILLSAQEAKDGAKHPSHKKSELRIGIISQAMADRFAAKVKTFRAVRSDLKLSVRHENASVLHRLLDAGEIDVAFTRPFHTNPNLKERHLEWDIPQLAIPSDHPWAKRKNIPWSLLTGEPVLLVAPEFNPHSGQMFLHMCGQYGCLPKVSYAASDLPSLIWLVMTGLGVCPYPSSLAEWAPQGVVFRPFKPACRPLELVLMWAAKNETPILRAFIELFDESRPSRPKHPRPSSPRA